MNTLEVLTNARFIISDIEHWCQGAYAIDNTGSECAIHEDFTYAFCAVGALCKVATHDTIAVMDLPAYRALNKAVEQLGDSGGVASWNDGEEYEIAHARVLRAFDLAIEKAKA